MAFPEVRSVSTGVETQNTTDWDVIYVDTIIDGGGSAIVAGDLLLLTIGCDGANRSFTNFVTGWASVIPTPFYYSDGSCSLVVWRKIATGSETPGGLIGTGTGSTITCSASEQGAWRMTCIKNWFGTDAGVAIQGATGASADPDPPSLTLPWGSGIDTLIRAIGASDGSVTITAYPSGYTLNQFADHSGGGAGAGMYAAGAQVTTSPQDPGTFTLSGSDGWAVATVGIRGVTLTPVSQTYAVPYEALQELSKLGLNPWEARGVVQALRTTPFEALGNIAPTMQLPLEALEEIAYIIESPYEGLSSPVVVPEIPWEGTEGISDTETLPWESLVTLQAVHSVPWEARTGSKQTGVARLSLEPGSEPTSRTNHAIVVRARKTNAAHVGTIRVRLYEGATPRSAELETTALTDGLVTYTLPIADVDAASIVSYNDLEIRMYGFAGTGDSTVFEVAEVCLQIPEAANVVTANYVLPYEAMQVLQATFVKPYESLQIISAANGQPYESLEGIQSSFIDPWEALQGISSQYILPWEAPAPGVVSAPFILPYEALQLVSTAYSKAWESLQIITRTDTSPYETLQSIASLSGVPYESLEGITRTSDMPWEALVAIASTLLNPYEALQGISIASDLPYEALEGISALRNALYESLEGISSSYILPWEAPSPSGVQRFFSLPWEALQGISQTFSKPYEGLQGLSITSQDPWESLIGISSSELLPWEAQSISGVTSTFILPWEAIGWIATQPIIPWEAPQGISRVDTFDWETLQALQSLPNLPYEAVSAIASTPLLPWEARGWVTADHELPWESLLFLSTSGELPYETLLLARLLAQMPWEAESPLIPAYLFKAVMYSHLYASLRRHYASRIFSHISTEARRA